MVSLGHALWLTISQSGGLSHRAYTYILRPCTYFPFAQNLDRTRFSRYPSPVGILDKLFGSTPKKQPVHLDDASFEAEVLRSQIPVIVDVWGARCGPCKQLEPIIMELAGEYDGRVKICEINAETAPRTMVRLGVQSTPTVLYFKGGKELERVTGFRSSLYHRQAIEELFTIAPK